jgi:CrcB protein
MGKVRLGSTREPPPPSLPRLVNQNDLPLGTLSANLVGGYVIGLAIEYFSEHGTMPAEARLLIVTGFCGALTTFSTFSAEVVTLLSEQRYTWSLMHIASHLFGSVAMTVLGILTVKGLHP